MTPAWMMTANPGDRIVCIAQVRNVAILGKVYVITRFYNHPRMRSQHGEYDLGFLIDGNRTNVFDPRSFRPLETRPTDISIFYRMLIKQAEPA